MFLINWDIHRGVWGDTPRCFGAFTAVFGMIYRGVFGVRICVFGVWLCVFFRIFRVFMSILCELFVIWMLLLVYGAWSGTEDGIVRDG